jgi:hypothetical protein
MAHPLGSNLHTLFQFIAVNVPPAGIGGAGPQYRDLDQYYQWKKQQSPIPAGGGLSGAKQMMHDAMAACGLASHGVWNAAIPNHDKVRAAAATVLAMAIIKDTSASDLQSHYQRLLKQSVPMTMQELRKLLEHGDTVQSNKYVHLELKNFASAGKQQIKNLHFAEEAYGQAYSLLMGCRQDFILAQALSPAVSAAFTRFFGPPNAAINTANLQFDAAHPLAWVWPAPVVPAIAVVRAVLRRVVEVFLTQEQVRMYFGGKAIDRGTYAYVRQVRNPSKIHLGGEFFGLKHSGVDSRGGTIVHELTHTWSATEDHAYGLPAALALLVANVFQALSNADNYQYFVETAF